MVVNRMAISKKDKIPYRLQVRYCQQIKTPPKYLYYLGGAYFIEFKFDALNLSIRWYRMLDLDRQLNHRNVLLLPIGEPSFR